MITNPRQDFTYLETVKEIAETRADAIGAKLVDTRIGTA